MLLLHLLEHIACTTTYVNTLFLQPFTFKTIALSVPRYNPKFVVVVVLHEYLFQRLVSLIIVYILECSVQ